MRNAHIVSIGSESVSSLNPHCYDGYVSLPFFSFSEYVSLPSQKVLCEIGIEFVAPEYPSNDHECYIINTVTILNLKNLVILCK